MKFRFLLFFILAFLFGIFSVKAQDLVYNGEVEIEIRLNKICGRYIHDNDSWAECRLRFWKNDVEQDYVFASGIKIDKSYWQDFDHDYLPGYWLYKKKVKLSGKTLVDYYSDSDYTFSFKGWEHDGGNSSDKHVQYGDFSVKSLLEDNNSPGWHTKKIESAKGSDVHSCWMIEVEYYITPPSIEITSPSADETSFEEGSVVPLKVDKPEGANFEYEWSVQIDNATTPDATGQKVVSYMFIDAYEGTYGSFPWATALGRELTAEEEANPNLYSSLTNEEIRTLTRYCELFVIHEGFDSPLYQFYYDNLIDEYEDIPVFVPAIDSKTGSNITSDGTCDYQLPESNKFHRNFKFKVQTIVRTDGKDPLRCIEEDKVIIVDVFPHYPDIQPISGGDKKTVTCFGGSDGEIKIKVDGDLGTNGGVVAYRATVWKTDDTYSDSKTFETSEFTFYNLSEGDYELTVSNGFNPSNTENYEDKDKTKYNGFFLLGHETVPFTIIENDKIELEKYAQFISNSKCDQYVVDIDNITAKGGLGGYKYSLDNDNISTKPRVLADALELPGYGEGKNIPLYIEDVAGCIGQGTAVLTRDLEFEFIVADENLPIISCFGATTNFQVSAQGGSGTYQFDLDKEIDSNSPISNELIDFDVNAGSHTFYAKESHGCASNIERTFEENEAVEIYDFVRTKKVIGKEIHISCNGYADGEVKFKIRGGTKPYTYTLSKGLYSQKDNVDSADTEVVIGNLSAGSYSLVIEDSNGCSLGSDKTFELKEPSEVQVTPTYADYSGFNYKCFGDVETIELEVSEGIAPYSLKYGSTNKEINISGGTTGFDVQGTKPQIEISDALGCKPNFKVELKEPAVLGLNLFPNNYTSGSGEVYNIKQFGETDEIRVKASGGIAPYTIKLLKDDVEIDSEQSENGDCLFTGVKAGTYKVSVTGKHLGCSETTVITLKEPEKLELPITYHKTNGFDIACKGLKGGITVKPIGGISPYALTVNGVGVSRSFTNLGNLEKDINEMPAGTYNLILRDSYNVELASEVILIEPEKLSLNLSTTVYQGGFQIKCSDLLGYVDVTPEGGAGTTYNLLQMCDGKSNVSKENTGATRFDNLDEGHYTYILTDINGCTIEESIEIKKPEELKINFGAVSIPSCHELDMGDDSKKEDGQIQLSINGGATLGYNTNIYQLVVGQPDIGLGQIEGNSPVFNSLETGNYKFVTVDANGCRVEDSQNLGQPDLLQIIEGDMTLVEPTCFDYDNGFWESDILGGTTRDGQYSYTITKEAEVNAGRVGKEFNQSNLSAGKYLVEIADDNGCYFKMENELRQPNFIVNQLFVLGVDILSEGGVANFDCFGSEDGSEIIVNGGTANYSVQIWKEGSLYQELNKVAEDVGVSAKNFGAGNYSILTTDSRGCQSNKVDFKLNQPEEIKFVRDAAKYVDDKTGEVFDFTCFGARETIGVMVEGGFAPYQITYNGETNVISESGGYVDFEVTGTGPVFDIVDAKNCPKQYKPILKEPLELQLELSSNLYESNKAEQYQIKCFGATDSIWARATGGITPYTFELFDASNTKMVTKHANEEVFFEDLPAGIYNVKVTGAYNTDCFVESAITLKQPDPIQSNIILSNFEGFEIRCNGLTDSVKVQALGGISPYKLKLTNVSIVQEFEDVSNEIQTFKNIPAGKYQLSITDKLEACEYKKEIVLTEPTAIGFDIETSHYEGDFEIRCSYLRDSVKITPLGGIPITSTSEYTIEQTDERGDRQLGNVAVDENLVFKNLDAGMFSYTVSDVNRCKLNKIIELRKPDSLEITGIDFTIPTCHEKDMGDISKRSDGEIKVQIQGGVSFGGGYYDYLLNKMPHSETTDRLDSIRGITNAVFKSLETGEYIIEVRDINACRIKIDEQQLQQADWLHIEKFNLVIPQCYEAKDGFLESEIIGGISATGNYSYVLSKNGEAFRNGSTGIEWNQDQLGKGKYIIEITDDLGCYFKQEEEMLQPDEMSIDFNVMGVTDFGNNDGAAQVRVSGGNGGYRYQWYHKGEKYLNGEHERIDDLYAGEYTVEVWDQNNCPYGNNDFGIANGLKKTVSIKEPGSKLSIVANPVMTSYYGAEDGGLQVSAVGGWPYAVWPGYEFSLNHGDWTITNQFENLKAGLYHVRVRDSKGVLDSIEVEVEEPDEIIIQLEKRDCLCNRDNSGEVTVRANGGTAPYTYAINYAIDFNRSNEFTGLKAGSYRIFVKDKLGNVQSKYVDIEEPEALNIEFIDLKHSTCNSSNGSVQIQIFGGSPDYYVDWGDFYPNDKLHPNNLRAKEYFIEVTDANSCTSTKSFLVEEMSGPEISLKQLKEVSCHESKDGEIVIEVNNGTTPYDIVWRGLDDSYSTVVNQLGKGSYSVTVSDANNCFDEAEYEITGPEELELYVSSLQSPNCVGINDGSILMTAIGGSPEYIYSLNEESNKQGWFNNLGAGEMMLQVTDVNGCKKELEAELTAPVPVTIELPNEYFLCKNQTEIVSSGIEGANSSWFYNDVQFSNEKEVELYQEGNYLLKLTTDKGCKAEHEFNLSYLDYEVVADFIIPVEAIVGDTIVAVDISWEMPDSVRWVFPNEMEVIKKQDASIWFRVLQAGSYDIGMYVFKNECSDYVEKIVNVANISTKRKAGFIQPKEAYVMEAKLYPNPNRGDFHLNLVLNKMEDVNIQIFDVQRAIKIDSRAGFNSAIYQFDFNDKSLFRAHKTYAVVILVGNEKRVLKFLVF
nr:SprB repeat-containing protein [uncultured Marinifilum sp.]